MTRTPRLRRPATVTAAVSAAALLGALLPVTLAPAAVAAGNGCLSEVETGAGPLPFLQPGGRCDDQVPPEAELISVGPLPNAAGYVNADTLSFTFTGAHPDDDEDLIGFECQFFSTPSAPNSWTACGDSNNLTTSVPYTFKVRAFDAVDRDITATDDPSTNPLIPGTPAETDLPDEQATPEVAVVKVDTKAPQTYIFNTPYDPETPELPMLTTDSPTFRLASSEGGVSFDCDIDGQTLPCANGNTTFPKLPAGTLTLSVGSTDRAGNVDPDPATTEFTVPRDIPQPKKRWDRSVSGKAFGGATIVTTAKNARFGVRGTDVREVRLIATTRPDAGVLKYKVPGGVWQKVKLNSRSVERGAVVIVRNTSSKSFTGKMKFKTFSKGRPVEVDAIMMR